MRHDYYSRGTTRKSWSRLSFYHDTHTHCYYLTVERPRILSYHQLILLDAVAVIMPPIKFLCLHGLGTNAAVRFLDLVSLSSAQMAILTIGQIFQSQLGIIVCLLVL